LIPVEGPGIRFETAIRFPRRARSSSRATSWKSPDGVDDRSAVMQRVTPDVTFAIFTADAVRQPPIRRIEGYQPHFDVSDGL
jgi:hypothetical protein